MNKFAFIVPVYKHGSTLDYVVSSLQKFSCPVIVVDDGNIGEDRKFIDMVEEKYSSAIVVRNETNKGKGVAVCRGIEKAHELQVTHVLQIDSDGQHDIERVEHFLKISEQNPDAIICGYPEYDESVPRHRFNGRKISNFFARVVTLSSSIKDVLIGFRVYPVEPFYNLIKQHVYIDSRMGFDTDILVRLCWKNVPVISESVKVSYPKDGISNFRVVRDNVRISFTFSRLFIGMVLRFPCLIASKFKRHS